MNRLRLLVLCLLVVIASGLKSPRGGSTTTVPKNTASSVLLQPTSASAPQTVQFVTKRDGKQEPLDIDKIRQRLNRLSNVDTDSLVETIVNGLYEGVLTDEIDVLAAESAAAMSTQDLGFADLAAQLLVSRNRKLTPSDFSLAVAKMASDEQCFLDSDLVDLVSRRADEIDEVVRQHNMTMTYFGFKTLERSYLLRMTDGSIVERPEYLIMRTALGIHCGGQSNEDEQLAAAFETYRYMVQGYFTHASPTLFHSGTTHPQLSSCFLLQMKQDSIVGIYETLMQCALISKSAGGIGLSVHNIRSRGTSIHGTRGVSNGLVPMLRVYDATSRYVDQGGGKRPGAFCIYLEPWHADIFEVLNLKKNHGKEEQRARDLFYGIWIPDLFMERVESDGVWSLMCPHQSPGLASVHGEEFRERYEAYEANGQYVRQVRARDLWSSILQAQMETGTPYMLYKDACNAKSNQQNLGTIQCSNLCTEIVQYCSEDEIAVCNLASICLPKFVLSDKPFGSSKCAQFDHASLHKVVKTVVRNLNKIIDRNQYPLPEAANSNKRHRPMGIGVSGLADTFMRLGLPFTSDEAKQLNSAIFETIYHAALEASNELALQEGCYETFEGSPASKGVLQFDMWEDTEFPSHKQGIGSVDQIYPEQALDGYDWDGMRARMRETGLRNSLLVAPMPTASTSQILGVNECFEPFSSNLYIRRVKAGEFIMANPHLLQDLADRGLWNSDIRNQLMRDGGSVQNIKEIPDHIKELYKTVWEIKMKDIIDMAADRGRFIDQSQSLNLFLADPNLDRLTAMHFYAWKKGLKTGMYYLRTKPAVNAIQYTVEKKDDAVCLSCQG